MAIYIANENGDWWEHVPGSSLYILNTEDLAPEELAEIEENWGPLTEGDLPDKLEKAIWQYGWEVNEQRVVSQL